MALAAGSFMQRGLAWGSLPFLVLVALGKAGSVLGCGCSADGTKGNVSWSPESTVGPTWLPTGLSVLGHPDLGLLGAVSTSN